MNYPLTPNKIIQEKLTPNSIRFNLLHIDKLHSKQAPKLSPHGNQNFIYQLRNRGILSSIKKYYKEGTPKKVKHSNEFKKSNTTEGIRQHCYTSVCKPKQTNSNLKKRFSTQCRNYHKASQIPEIDHPPKQISKYQSVNPQRQGIPILIPRRNNKITINKLLEEKHQKKRDYEFSKFSSTNIIPDYLIYSKREGQSQQRRLIKNISQKVYYQYRVSPNFQSQ